MAPYFIDVAREDDKWIASAYTNDDRLLRVKSVRIAYALEQVVGAVLDRERVA